LMVNAALPVFLTAKLCGALDVPLIWLPKIRLAGETLSVGPAGGVPTSAPAQPIMTSINSEPAEHMTQSMALF